MKVSLIQMNSIHDKATNLALAKQIVARGPGHGRLAKQMSGSARPCAALRAAAAALRARPTAMRDAGSGAALAVASSSVPATAATTANCVTRLIVACVVPAGT